MLNYCGFMLQIQTERRKDRPHRTFRLLYGRELLFYRSLECPESLVELAREMRHHSGKADRRPSVRRSKEVSMAAQSYDRLEGGILYDGKLVPWNEANVHVLTHGLHYASCVFEGERAYGGTIFKSTEHSERLKRSANILDFEIPYSVVETAADKT